jgi:hypothetical protein
MAMLALFVLSIAVVAAGAVLDCPVAFDVAPELRERASMARWTAEAHFVVSLMNRELRMHGSALLFSVHSVSALDIGLYGTPSATLAAYASGRPAVACVHLLLSQRSFSGIIGLAYVDKRCTAQAFAAVFDGASRDTFRQTAFHEILHVVGLEHAEDDATSVMAPALAWNFGLGDDPSLSINATRRGCEGAADR